MSTTHTTEYEFTPESTGMTPAEFDAYMAWQEEMANVTQADVDALNGWKS